MTKRYKHVDVYGMSTLQGISSFSSTRNLMVVFLNGDWRLHANIMQQKRRSKIGRVSVVPNSVIPYLFLSVASAPCRFP